ncbi:hypothetical protein EJ03DRAFT_328967 [Teratosphaeria nubilosa]|uniref:Secreted protein n=1 Tax=Teratosphaeria nubilosa TaxID=161662 RepID=A0A6G1L5C4_9PEZI|nr:hypothetical protein EJ03DRAFT_328967 [Teratosphaeria nubilosa]
MLMGRSLLLIAEILLLAARLDDEYTTTNRERHWKILYKPSLRRNWVHHSHFRMDERARLRISVPHNGRVSAFASHVA